MSGIKNFFQDMVFYVSVCFRKYFDFKGRARRREYWYFALFTWLVGNFLSLAYSLSGLYVINYIANIYTALMLIPTLAVAFRRVHDIGYSGKYVVFGYAIMFICAAAGATFLITTENMYYRIVGYALFVFPIAVVLAYLYFFTKDSQPSENKWGANPKEIEI